MSALIEFRDVCKHYKMGGETIAAADHISMGIQKGEFVAIVGQSGSGKSTCMNIIGCLDVPSSGTYLLDGRDVGQMDKNELAEIRNELLGFIFQQYNLLPKLTLLENVEVPMMYAGIPMAERHERARVALELVGLGGKLRHRPSQLSGGQQQRVSVARALVGEPAVILADEPTGALDSHTSREVLNLLQQLHRAGNTVVLITHDNSIAVQAQRIFLMITSALHNLKIPHLKPPDTSPPYELSDTWQSRFPQGYCPVDNASVPGSTPCRASWFLMSALHLSPLPPVSCQLISPWKYSHGKPVCFHMFLPDNQGPYLPPQAAGYQQHGSPFQ